VLESAPRPGPRLGRALLAAARTAPDLLADGWRYLGLLRRHQVRADGSFRDTVVFSILRDEWPAVRAGLITRLAAPTDATG